MNTILTVRSEDFARIDEESRAVEFFQDLLWAEAARVGLPLGNVNISLKTKTSDGGVDATVLWPSGSLVASSIFANEYTAYQIKAGKSFEPWQESAIKKELFGRHNPGKDHLSVMVRDALDRGGRYVLVCFGHDLTSEQQGMAVKHLGNFLQRDCNYKNPQVAVWSQNNLASFLGTLPSLVLRVKSLAGNFQTHESWASDANTRVTFVPGESQVKLVQTLQDALRQNSFHVRITGEPGIGKTRLVFEATKAADLCPLVLYCDAEDFLRGDLLYDLTREDAGHTAILVLDECNPDRRAYVANKLKGRSPRLRLISIYAEADRASDVIDLEVSPLDENAVSGIIQGYGVPGDVARKWVSVCGGSPRVAHLVGMNLRRNPQDMLREPDTERVWDRYIAGSDDLNSPKIRQYRLVLMYIALFKRFGFGQPVTNEARSIHRRIEAHDPTITWPRFQEIIQGLRNRKLLQGETTLYITPKLLHIKLWIDWWNTFGSTFSIDQIPDLTTSSLHDWFLEMFEYAAGVAPMRVSHIVNGARPITAELALLFGRALGQSSQYWLNLQTDYDLKRAEATFRERLQAVVALVPA